MLKAVNRNLRSLCPSGILCVKQRKLCSGVFYSPFRLSFFVFLVLQELCFQASSYNFFLKSGDHRGPNRTCCGNMYEWVFAFRGIISEMWFYLQLLLKHRGPGAVKIRTRCVTGEARLELVTSV